MAMRVESEDKMTQEELNKVLENHKNWLNEDCCGWEGMKADLSYADLRNADLSNANLSYANLCNADLCNVDLSNSNLSDGDLSNSNLSDGDLRNADLSYANLSYANLSYANLRNADLSYANLRYADLRYANLSNADLRYADLRYANLSNADLRNADLRGARNVPFIPYACPDFGSFIGYKKASGYIVELEILDDAKRLSATSRKCRCNKVKVLRILHFDRTVADVTEVKSSYDSKFIYKVGDIVSVDNFDEDRFNECGTGIHFFINFQEAANYLG